LDRLLAPVLTVDTPPEKEVRAEQRQEHEAHQGGEADQVPGEIQSGLTFQ
jgi:hypothetical protein